MFTLLNCTLRVNLINARGKTKLNFRVFREDTRQPNKLQ